MRKKSLQKVAMEQVGHTREEDKQRKISNINPPSLKHRKPSMDYSNFEKQAHNNSERKVSLKSICILSKETPPVEYDPYEHRNVKNPTSYFQTLIHMIKGSMGTGILAMPYAFSNAGYLIGIFGTLLIGFICTYTVHMLVSSAYELCKRHKKPSMTYPEATEAAIAGGPVPFRGLAKVAKATCNAFLLMYEIGGCGIYIVFISTNLKDVVDQYQFPEHRWEVRWYCLFILGPLILLKCIRSYKYLAPLSTIANILSITSFLITFYYLFSDLPDISNREAIAPIEKLPLYFGTVVFAMEAIGVVFPLENEMSDPKSFGTLFGVLNCSMIPITLLYTCVGLFGFLRYGDKVLGSITLSLPPDKIFSQAVRVMLSISIFCTYGLLLHPAIDIIWTDFVKPRVTGKHIVWEYVVCISTVLLTFFLAVAVPFLELFISFVGAFCMSMLGLMFPAVVQTCTFWHELSGTRFVLFFLKNVSIAMIAAYGLALGVKTSFEGIIEKF